MSGEYIYLSQHIHTDADNHMENYLHHLCTTCKTADSIQSEWNISWNIHENHLCHIIKAYMTDWRFEFIENSLTSVFVLILQRYIQVKLSSSSQRINKLYLETTQNISQPKEGRINV